MAIYHLSAKVIGRSSGRSSTAAAAYRAGERIKDARSGLVHDYSRRKGVLHSEIIAPEAAPDWARNRAALWNEVEAAEKRKDAQLTREMTLALPDELDADERLKLVQDFCRERFVDQGMIADIAIHGPGHSGDQRNHHAHVMLTTRTITAEGFGQKNRDWNSKETLETWRRAWEEAANQALEQSGHEARIDHRSLTAQGIDRKPQIHVGPKAKAMQERGIKPVSKTREDGRGRVIRYPSIDRWDRVDLYHRSQPGENGKATRAEYNAHIIERNEREAARRRQQEENYARLQAQRAEEAEERRRKAEEREREWQERERRWREEQEAERRELELEAQRRAEEREQAAEEAAAANRYEALIEEAARTEKATVGAKRETNRWADDHPWRARMHRLGIVKAKPLQEIENRVAAATAARQRLNDDLAGRAAWQKREDARNAARMRQEAMKREQERLESEKREKAVRDAQKAVGDKDNDQLQKYAEAARRTVSMLTGEERVKAKIWLEGAERECKARGIPARVRQQSQDRGLGLGL